ncbi:MAG: CBS domain-containing protein, partial [Halobacteriaceae archaeon]
EGIKAVGNRYTPTRNVEIPSGPVREFMTRDLVTVTGRKDVQEVAKIMLSNDIEQVPLMSGDSLAGIVLDEDIIRSLV